MTKNEEDRRGEKHAEDHEEGALLAERVIERTAHSHRQGFIQSFHGGRKRVRVRVRVRIRVRVS